MTATCYSGPNSTRIILGRMWFGGSKVDGKGPKDRCLESAEKHGHAYLAARDIADGPKEYTHYGDFAEFAKIRGECCKSLKTRTLYELIRPDQPSWGYVDLDDRVALDSEGVDYPDHFKRLHDAFAFDVLGADPCKLKYNVSTATRKKEEILKVSYHIVVHGLVLTDIDARQYWCDSFSRYIREQLLDPDSTYYHDANMLLSTEHASSYIEQNIKEMLANPEAFYDDEGLKLMIDSHIYGKDWCFRSVGMHKFSERDPLASLRICGGSEDVRDHAIIVYPTTDISDAHIVTAPESWFGQGIHREKNRRQYTNRCHGAGVEQIARTIEAMKATSPGSFLMNVEQHMGDNGRLYYMSRWSVDPSVLCLICKKEKPHRSQGHGPRVCEFLDGRVIYTCWKKGPKHAVCIMDRREFIAEKVPFSDSYSLEKIKPFDVEDMADVLRDRSGDRKITHFVQSNCGTGKSERIRETVNELVRKFPDLRILCIVANISLSKEEDRNYKQLGAMGKEWVWEDSAFRALYSDPGFCHYQDRRGGFIKDSRVLIVLNSIRRLACSRFDVVILDEIYNTLSALSGTHLKNKAEVVKKLVEVIEGAKILIALDATVTAKVYNFIASYRPVDSIRASVNTYTRPTNRALKWINVDTKRSWKAVFVDRIVSECRDRLERGEKVFCPMSGAWAVSAVCEGLKDILSTKTWKSYTKDTPKKDLEEGANSAWAGLDFLITSPTITVGVSYTLHTFDSMVAGLINAPMYPEYTTMLQQMFRVRHLCKGDMTVFYRDSTTPMSRMETDFGEIKKNVLDTEARLLNLMAGDNADVVASWGDDGSRIFDANAPLLNLYCRNLQDVAVSRSHYKENLTRILRDDYGVRVEGDEVKIVSEEAAPLPKVEDADKDRAVYIMEHDEYNALKDKCDEGEVLTPFEKRLKNIYELAEFSYQIPRECRDEELAGLLDKDKCRTTFRAIRQHSRATELGKERYLANVLGVMQKSHSMFDLSTYKTGKDAKSLAATLHLLEGSGIGEFILDRESARTMTLPRDKVIELGNRIDQEIMDKQTYMRAVFGYRRRAGGGAGTLSFAQCSSLINTLLESTMGISARGSQSDHKKANDLEISKAAVLDFCERYRPEFWGNEAVLESIRHHGDQQDAMDETYQFR